MDKPFADLWIVVSVRDAGPLHVGTHVDFARTAAEAEGIAARMRREWDHVRVAAPQGGELPGQKEGPDDDQ